MKKSLLAFAVAGAFAAPAMAQSSVTLFGAADVAFQQRSGSNNGSINRLGSSGLSSSAIGFRGTEDLGGGMRAEFWFEGDIGADNGTGTTNLAATNQANSLVGGGFTFNRRSTVALAGGWGEVRLGRDFNPVFRNVSGFDPFGTLGAGAASNLILGAGASPAVAGVAIGAAAPATSIYTTAVRVSNLVQYFSPNFNGFQAIVAYGFGENNSNAGLTSKDGNFWGLRLGYAAGPLSVAYAYSNTKYGATATVGDVTRNNLGASYNFGVATAMFQWNNTKVNQAAGVTPKQRDYLLGVNVPVGAGNIRASYINSRVDSGAVATGSATATQWAIGYIHNLSRRTALYATYATINNGGYANGTGTAFQNGVAATGTGRRSSGYDIGLRHSF